MIPASPKSHRANRDSMMIMPSSITISQLFYRVFLISVAIQILTQGLLLAFVTDDVQIKSHYAVLLFTRVLQIPQVIAIVYSTWILVTNISVASLVDAWIMYLSTILCFAGIYHVLQSGAISPAFVSDDPRMIEGNPSHVYASMLYFSVSTQTLTGYGDITASDNVGMIITSAQMLAGMLYSVFIISHTQEIFFDRVRFIDVKRDEERRKNRGVCGRCWDFFTKNHYVRKTRQFVREYLVVISTLIYVTNFLTLQYVNVTRAYQILLRVPDRNHSNIYIQLKLQRRYLEPDVFGNWEYRVGILVMEILIQSLQIGSVVMTSWKFIKHTDEITLSYLSQAFVAICLTFSGLYNLLFAFSSVNNRCFSLPVFEIGKTSSITVVVQLLYFSISTMTSAGQGDVYPRRWYVFSPLWHSWKLICDTLGNSKKKKFDIQNNFTNQVCAMASVCSNVNIGTLYCCFSGPRCDKVERSA